MFRGKIKIIKNILAQIKEINFSFLVFLKTNKKFPTIRKCENSYVSCMWRDLTNSSIALREIQCHLEQQLKGINTKKDFFDLSKIL